MYNLNEIVFSVTRAVDGINPKFNFHSRMVAYTALTISNKLDNDGLKKEDVLLSALLHDIGVVRLRQRELSSFLENIPKQYYDHEKIGANILGKYKKLSHLSKPIAYHHLSWDKTNEVNDEVPLLSHILHMSDRIAVNFITNCENYYSIKKAKNFVIDFLIKNKGKNFSHDLVDLVIDKLANYEEFWLNLYFISDLDFNKMEQIFSINPIYIDENELKQIVPFFGEIIDSHSSFTKCHSIFVANIAYLISDFLGQSDRNKNFLYISGYLHDLGKIYVPTEILEKPGPLNNEEREIINLHPYFTRKILSDIKDFVEIADTASNHHERIDGSGYPRGLKDEELSIFSKILMICDILASFLENRPYRNAYDLQQTINLLFDWAREGKLAYDLVRKVSEIKIDIDQLINNIFKNYYCEVHV